MSVVEQELKIDREASIEKNIDCLGREWVIQKRPHFPALFICRPKDDREDAIIPKQIVGSWTSMAKMKTQLESYLKASWDKADMATEHNEAKKRNKEK